MADHSDQVGIENSQADTPLLSSNQNQNQSSELTEQLKSALKVLDVLLRCLGFHQSSVLSRVLSCSGLVIVGIALPVLVVELKDCADCKQYQIKDFDPYVVASQALLAAVSLFCLSHNLGKYGIKRFLTVGRKIRSLALFRKDYVEKIQGSMHLLLFWALPCFILKAAREAIRILYAERLSWRSVAVFLVMTISWTYLSLIFLLAAIVFHLICHLQIIHFDDYAKLLQTESEVLLLLNEHIILCRRLSRISQSFQIFLLLEFVFVTSSQLMTLFQTMTYSGKITLINFGDFVVSAIVQVAGIILCLHGATKISHRAQEIASEASRWHALVTCGPGDVSQPRNPNENSDATSILDVSQPRNPNENLDAISVLDVSQPRNPNEISDAISDSESDLDSLYDVTMPTATQLAFSMSSYHKREAFVMYLQMNPGGITIFGWTVNRDLLNTLFFIELTLITFVLGKTLVVT